MCGRLFLFTNYTLEFRTSYIKTWKSLNLTSFKILERIVLYLFQQLAFERLSDDRQGIRKIPNFWQKRLPDFLCEGETYSILNSHSVLNSQLIYWRKSFPFFPLLLDILICSNLPPFKLFFFNSFFLHILLLHFPFLYLWKNLLFLFQCELPLI